MDIENGTQYQLGQLTAQIAAIGLQLSAIQLSFTAMETRLRKNEENTTVLLVKMGAISIIAGGVGSLLLTLILDLTNR